MLRDYDARELSAHAGDEFDLHEEVAGWAYATNGDGKTGWLPVHCLNA